MKSPLGMDLDSPRLFWKVETKSRSARGLSQTAYQIQAATIWRLLRMLRVTQPIRKIMMRNTPNK